MSRTRWWTAVGIVGVLAVIAGLLVWRDRSTTVPTTTTLLAVPSTTQSATTSPVISPTIATTTTSADQRIEEVEAILTDLWFGWLDAIYRKDPDALWDVVATTPKYEAGIEAMKFVDFTAEPTIDGVEIEVEEILLDRDDCLVVHRSTIADFVDGGASSTGVDVLWPDARYGWRLATAWLYPQDLWMDDCDFITRESTP